MPEADGLSGRMRLPILSVLRGVLTCGEGDDCRCRKVLNRCDRIDDPTSRDREGDEPGALRDCGDRLGVVDLRPQEGLEEIDGADRPELIEGLGRLGLIDGLRLGDGALGRGDGAARRL